MKRYDFHYRDICQHEDDEGDWVRFEDAYSWGSGKVESLIAERDAVRTSYVTLECQYARLMDQMMAERGKVAKLEEALRGLYWDNVDYLRLNHLGGMDNHWMKAAREALGIALPSEAPKHE